MPTSDPAFVRQLHADRTARLAGGARLHLPRLAFVSRSNRKEQRRAATRLATTC